LTFAFLRVETLYEMFERELRAMNASGESDEVLRRDAAAAIKRIENTSYGRVNALFMLQLAALYAVVERWQIWRFADSSVDQLLDEPHVRLLENFRHVIFHADYHDHKDLPALAEHDETLEWAAKLSSAFPEYLRRWHADPVGHVTEHLNRVGW
jgi:hypothetical protein